jgi:signal peptidase I
MIEAKSMKNRRFLFNLFLVSTVTAVLFRVFVIEDFRIVSDSMMPNLRTGQLIIVSKVAFSIRLPFTSFEMVKFRRPERSEVVAFNLPEKRNETYVKRVVAVAGDRVEIKDGKLYINGQLTESREATTEGRQLAQGQPSIQLEKTQDSREYQVQLDKDKISNYGPVDVPSNHFFALGDNRSDSVDSRAWGPVPYSCLKGRVLGSF